LDEQKQKRVFLRDIGGNEESLKEERAPNANGGIHAGLTHIKEYKFEELEALFSEAVFGVRAPLMSA
jgi:hypothetical protein